MRLLLTAGLIALACVAAPLPAQINRYSVAERAAFADLDPSEAAELTLRDGWFRERPIAYFDFGPMPVTTVAVIWPVYGIDSGGRPQPIPGQRPIFTSLPGLPGYTAYSQIQYLVVPRDTPANAITDGRQATSMVLNSEAQFVYPRLIANLPIVPRGSFLQGDPVKRTVQLGWYRGVEVPYFDFGLISIAPVPLYTFVSGTDSTGAPVFLRAQHNIVDVVPGDGRLSSDVWDINFVRVDERYAPNRWRSLAMLRDSASVAGYRAVAANDLRNCPVVIIDGKPAARPATPFAKP